MNAKFLFAALLGFSILVAPACFADSPKSEPAAAAQKAGKEKNKSGKVAKAVKKIKPKTFFNGKVSSKASYYIYLQSASWCGPCNAEMPEIVQEYKAMKKDGRVELILVGHDRSLEQAKAFLSKYKAGFPGLMASDSEAQKLPGFKMANGIPNAIIVDADGNQVASGHGSIVKKWRAYTIDKADEK